MIEVNEFQTPIEDLHLEDQPLEIQEQFSEIVNEIPYVRRLIAKDRPRAKDLPRDESGKIVIDVTHPHIIEDSDYFRPAAIHFQKTGKYTDLSPNKNPNSEFGKWIREEIRRCYYGYVRPSDGEWITGDMYFFLNYCPIQLIKKDKTGKSIRTIDFPIFWEGHYYKFHYLNQCRQEGKHAVELSKRGSGKSYCGAALLAKRFVLGESEEVNKKVQCVVTASERKYIQGANQILDMFQYYIDFNAVNTQFPYKRLTSSLQGMQWTMGYIDMDSNTRCGTENSVIGITSKDDEGKLRGSRGVLYLLEEAGAFPRLLNLYQVLRPSVEDGSSVYGLLFLYGCVCAGTKVWTNDGRYINIENLKKEDGIIGYKNDLPVKNTIGTLLEPRKKHCIRITWGNGEYLECSTDHPILKQIIHCPRIGKSDKRKRYSEETWVRADELKIGDRIIEGRYIGAFGEDTLEDPRLIGMLIGDGSYGYDNTPKFSSEDEELLNYIKERYEWGISGQHITKEGKQYQDIRVKGICPLLRKIGIYGQTKTNKRLPTNYQTLTEEDTKLLLAGLFDTDGCISTPSVNQVIQLTQATKEILMQISLLLRKFGILSSIAENRPSIKKGRKDKNPWYILTIAGRTNIQLFYENIPLLQKKKQLKLKEQIRWIENNPRKRNYSYDRKKIIIHKIIDIQQIGVQTIYNLSAEQSHTYLANNIITHNTAGDSDSDFSSMQELMYNPNGYNIKALDNVYDKEGQGRNKFTYFFPGYMNRANCYNKDGMSNVTKAIFEILKDRYTVKYNSTNVNAITKRIAEIPITPQEAILKSRGNMFPITQLNERLNQLDNNPRIYDDVYVGDLVQVKGKQVEFRPTGDEPIRDFPLKDNKAKGAIEIFQLPEKDNTGTVYPNRYIIGHDPVDSDVAETMSLTSTFVLDLFTDRIVAEYTGRQEFADDNFEKVRLLCLYYNAKCCYESNKKGIFAYFNKMGCLHLLCDTPQYLKDKQLIKTQGYGNSNKGINATLPINNYANELIRDWLLQPKTTVIQEDGEDKEILVSNLYFLKNRALIKELVLFNPALNVDRIRALGMCMLYRQEKVILYQGDMSRTKEVVKDEFGEDDEFFRINYDARFD